MSVMSGLTVVSSVIDIGCVSFVLIRDVLVLSVLSAASGDDVLNSIDDVVNVSVMEIC
jgi:hypothetical protein